MFQAFAFNTGLGLVRAAILLSICVAIEQVAVIERYSIKDRVPGAVFQVLGGVFGGLVAWSLQQLWLALGIGGITVVPLYRWSQQIPLGFPLYCLALLMITDFLIYWRHRAEHKWFWPIHAVHHSPRELHAANDIGHPLQAIPDFLIVWLPLSLIQMPGPMLPTALILLSSLLTMYIHSPIDFHFGPLRTLVVDNRFHRIHHSLEPRHFDKNFSVCFSCWDWLFGTAYWPAPDEWPAVGVTGIPHPRTAKDFMLQPLHNATNSDVAVVVVDTGEASVRA